MWILNGHNTAVNNGVGIYLIACRINSEPKHYSCRFHNQSDCFARECIVILQLEHWGRLDHSIHADILSLLEIIGRNVHSIYELHIPILKY